MKKKIIWQVAAFTSIILAIISYALFRIEETSSELKILLANHEAEVIRRNLSEKINAARWHLSKPLYNQRSNILLADIQEMHIFTGQCLSCHHSREIKVKIDGLRNELEAYEVLLRETVKKRGSPNLWFEEGSKVYGEGQLLIKSIESIIAQASLGLAEKKRRSLMDIEKTKKILFFLLLAAPILFLLTSLFMLNNIFKPLHAILNGLRTSKNGDSNFRIRTAWPKEFSELVSALNEMNHSLNEQISKMQRTEQLALCGQFAAGLVHEIKNPLAGIKGAIELFSEDLPPGGGKRETLELVISEINRIEFLLKSLLEFARPSKPQFMRVHVNDILENTIAFLHKHPSFFQGKTNGIKIVKDFGKDLPEITADPEQLRQVFLNLLLNAHEAMPAGGTVTIKTMLDPGGVLEVSISDTGPGIPIDLQDKIFEPFFTTKPKGTGLGLAISKRLIEQQGGEINAESNYHRGATFKIKFPIFKLIDSGGIITWPRSLLLKTMN